MLSSGIFSSGASVFRSAYRTSLESPLTLGLQGRTFTTQLDCFLNIDLPPAGGGSPIDEPELSPGQEQRRVLTDFEDKLRLTAHIHNIKINHGESHRLIIALNDFYLSGRKPADQKVLDRAFITVSVKHKFKPRQIAALYLLAHQALGINIEQ